MAPVPRKDAQQVIYRLAIIQAIGRGKGRTSPVCVAYCSEDGLRMLKHHVKSAACDDWKIAGNKVRVEVTKL